MFFNAFLLALREIRRNLLRSFLTVLGIVIGVASVIAMVMLGDGTTASVQQSIAKLGSNMLILQPGQDRRGPTRSDVASPPFKYADVAAIRAEVPGIVALAPAANKSMTAVYGNTTYTTTVTGSENDYLKVRDWELASGRAFLENEERIGVSVCIIGETARKELFGEADPVGSLIRLEKFSCEVVGLLAAKGASSFGMDQDDFIMVPFSLFQRRIGGNQDIRTIYLSADPDMQMESIKGSLTQLMRERRKLRAEMVNNFNIRDTKELMTTMTATTKTLTLLLGSVAAISLLVGGIGIMNIMLVSVTERTREIGIRLAIGALEREVLTQFLVEAVVLSSIGGLIGVALGLGIAVGVTSAFELPYIFNQNIVLIAFGFSALVGVVFGFFPARKAAQLDPIEALRHE
ncbi:MAG: ABC transporter permease [Campylobacterales bacterium]